MDDELVRRLAQDLGFKVVSPIRRGGYGQVYRGLDEGLEREVAIKALPAVGDAGLTQSLSESRVQAGSAHDHIVDVYTCAQEQGVHLIVMEYMANGTVTECYPRPTPEAACAITLGVASALACVHGKRYLHLDVKPDNLLADARGRVKLADFGRCRKFGGGVIRAGAPLGMTAYLAPEQLGDGELLPVTDTYALTLVLHQLLTGRHAFDPDQPDLRIRQEVPSLLGEVPRAIAEVVARGLAIKPEDRHTSALDFAFELAMAAADSYGPLWIPNSGVPLSLEDQLYRAAIGGFGSPQ